MSSIRWALIFDMSSAFDTIKRSTILRLLEDAGCSDDDIRLVRLLLANTKIRVRVNSTLSAEFVSANGAFQGDTLSGTLFTLSFNLFKSPILLGRDDN